MQTKGSRARRLRLAILNDSPHVLKLPCDWFRQHGHQCATRMKCTGNLGERLV
jgi:hypothetical protein